MPDANFLSFINPKLAAEQQKLQYQQALAQKLMEQGTTQDSDINKLANPGGFVVPYSPFQGLEKIGKAAAGKYLQDKSIEDQSKLYANLLNPQGGTPNPLGQQLADPNAAVDPSQVGHTQPPTQQTILELAQAGTVTGNPQTDMMFMMQSPTDYMKSLASRNAPTDLAKNVGNPSTQPYVAKDQLLNVNGHYQPAASLIPPAGGQATPPTQPPVANAPTTAVPQGNPPPPQMAGGQPQAPANMDELLSQQTPTPNAVDIVSPAGKNIDWNDPAAAKEATTRAEKIGAGEITPVEHQDIGRKQVSSVIGNIGKYYDDLNRGGGAVNDKNSAIENSAAYLGNSTPGQMFGKIAGTETQTTRNKIEQSRPLLINAIRQATGMSAKSMDSNTELQFYLKAATDPTLDITANKEALANLEKLYGLGAAGNAPAPSNVTHTYVPGKGIVPMGGR